jgi:putative endonuclease
MLIPRKRIHVGRLGEWIARIHLRLRGWRLVERNLRLSTGEIDLVVRRKKHVRLVEVRTTTSRYLECATLAASPRKQAQIRRVAREYLQRHVPILPQEVSIDVIGVRLQRDRLFPEVVWIRDAVPDARVPEPRSSEPRHARAGR